MTCGGGSFRSGLKVAQQSQDRFRGLQITAAVLAVSTNPISLQSLHMPRNSLQLLLLGRPSSLREGFHHLIVTVRPFRSTNREGQNIRDLVPKIAMYTTSEDLKLDACCFRFHWRPIIWVIDIARMVPATYIFAALDAVAHGTSSGTIETSATGTHYQALLTLIGHEDKCLFVRQNEILAGLLRPNSEILPPLAFNNRQKSRTSGDFKAETSISMCDLAIRGHSLP